MNVAAVVAIAGGMGVYYAVPDDWIKVVWGVASGAVVYLGLARLQHAAFGTGYPASPAVASSRQLTD